MENIIHLNSDNIEKSFRKILLMGNKGSGKTSIKSIIFQQKLPKDTIRLAPTNEIEEIHVKIMGSININLIDCCSKDEYNNKYFDTKKEKIFSKVDILIFVIDAFEFIKDINSERKKSLDYFKKCLETLRELSPDSKIYTFINKMDLLEEDNKNNNFMLIKKYFEKNEINNLKLIFLQTSIWDISIYKAWSNIFSEFIPKLDKVKELLKKFVSACWADEVVLLEKNTLIKICSYNDKELNDNERFEKMSEILKRFKYSCKIDSSVFKDITIKTVNNTIYIDEFENNTYIIVSFRNKKATLELIKINIEICKISFKELFDNE